MDIKQTAEDAKDAEERDINEVSGIVVDAAGQETAGTTHQLQHTASQGRHYPLNRFFLCVLCGSIPYL